MIAQNAPGLAREIVNGRMALIEPLLDLLLLPLAFHVMLLTATAAIPFAPARLYGLIALILVGCHSCAGILVGGGGWRDFTALMTVPSYALWKLKMAPRILKSAASDTPWLRTER